MQLLALRSWACSRTVGHSTRRARRTRPVHLRRAHGVGPDPGWLFVRTNDLGRDRGGLHDAQRLCRGRDTAGERGQRVTASSGGHRRGICHRAGGRRAPRQPQSPVLQRRGAVGLKCVMGMFVLPELARDAGPSRRRANPAESSLTAGCNRPGRCTSYSSAAMLQTVRPSTNYRYHWSRARRALAHIHRRHVGLCPALVRRIIAWAGEEGAGHWYPRWHRGHGGIRL